MKMEPDSLRIHHFEPASRSNGPGKRAVVWVQGCSFGCPGCFNPETHAMQGGQRWTVEALTRRILDVQDGLEGLTISGGEPLYQHRALARMLANLRAQTSLSVLVFTGFSWPELQRLRDIDSFLSQVDVLLAGRYEAGQRVASGLIGSANKTVHFLSNRYQASDLEGIPQAEVILSPDGKITFSGIDPLEW